MRGLPVSGILLLLVVGDIGKATVPTFPSVNDILPCNDLPENCATMYYNLQKSDQSGLDTLSSKSAAVANDAGSLLTSVQNVAGVAVGLADVIDPDNTRTNGGQIRVLPNGRSLVGLTPFMGTLSSAIVEEAHKRYMDISALMSELTDSLTQISALLQTSQEVANSQIVSTSNRIQNAITASSARVTDYIAQADSKMTSLSQQFAKSVNDAPIAMKTALANTLGQEQGEFTKGLAQLNNLSAEASLFPGALQAYVDDALVRLVRFEGNTQPVFVTLVKTRNNAFIARTNDALAKATASINGMLTTDPKNAYYNSSLASYIAQHQQSLYSQIAAENATQLAQVSSMLDSLTALSNSIATSFQPILTAVNLMLTQANATDFNFLGAAQQALTDADTTTQTAKASFHDFTVNMDTLWNTTGSILDGQTTEISAGLLDKISNITQEAGAEVANLNSLMLSASSSALASDGVRQAVLDSARQQVYSAIGSNAAALNASFATINDFLNKSSSEIRLIADIVNVISGNRTQQLNATATAGLKGVYEQIRVVGAAGSDITSGLVKNVQDDIAADLAAAQIALGGANSSLALSTNQTADLIKAMSAANDLAFANFTAQVNAAKALVNGTATTTAALRDTVGNISSLNAAKREFESLFLNQLMANATTNLTVAMAEASSGKSAMQSAIQAALSDLTSNQTTLVQNLTGSLNAATAAYGTQMSNISAVVDSIAARLSANNSMALQNLTDLDLQLTSAKSAVENAYRSAVSQVQSAASSLVASVQSNVTTTTKAAQSLIDSVLQANVSNVTGLVNELLSRLVRNSTRLQTEIASLSTTVQDLQSKPQELLDNAQKLASKYNAQLTRLKQDIIKVTSENDALSDDFEKELSAKFGDNGMDGMIEHLREKVDATQIQTNATLNATLEEIAEMVAAGDAALTLKAKDYIGQIQAHRNEFQADLDADSNATVTYMGTRYAQFLEKLADMQFRLNSTKEAAGGVDGRLSGLAGQVTDMHAEMASAGNVNGIAAKMQNFGDNFTNSVTAFLNSSEAALNATQRNVTGTQLVTATVALTGAQLLANATNALAAKVNATVSQILAESASSNAATAQTTGALHTVGTGASATVALTGAQIAQIIARFKADSAATQTALLAQQHATQNAAGTVSAALAVWESLKNTTIHLGQDELDTLTDLRADMINDTNFKVSAAQTKAQEDVDSISASIGQIRQNVTQVHNTNQGVIDSLLDELGGLAQEASEAQTDYQTQVSGLRGYVTRATQLLANRFDTVAKLGVPFRTQIETAATNDISAILKASRGQ